MFQRSNHRTNKRKCDFDSVESKSSWAIWRAIRASGGGGVTAVPLSASTSTSTVFAPDALTHLLALLEPPLQIQAQFVVVRRRMARVSLPPPTVLHRYHPHRSSSSLCVRRTSVSLRLRLKLCCLFDLCFDLNYRVVLRWTIATDRRCAHKYAPACGRRTACICSIKSDRAALFVFVLFELIVLCVRCITIVPTTRNVTNPI
jgi:hypothetical protein